MDTVTRKPYLTDLTDEQCMKVLHKRANRYEYVSLRNSIERHARDLFPQTEDEGQP